MVTQQAFHTPVSSAVVSSEVTPGVHVLPAQWRCVPRLQRLLLCCLPPLLPRTARASRSVGQHQQQAGH